MRVTWAASATVAVVAAAACGEDLGVESAPQPPPRDAGSHEEAAVSEEAGPTPDAEAPGCRGSAWTVPQRLAGDVNALSAAWPRVSADDLKMYFGRRDGSLTWSLWVAERATPTAPFGTPRRLDVALPDAGPEGLFDPTVLPDGRTIFFVAGPDRRIHRGRIDGTSVVDVVVIAFEGVPTQHQIQPFVTVDGRELWFAAYWQGQPARFFRAPLTQGEPGRPVEVDLARPGTEDFRNPTPSPDGTILILARMPSPTQLWWAKREDGGRYTAVGPLPVGASNVAEAPGSMTADGCRLYFTRDEDSRQGIWWTERTR